jgi:CTP:molybdopterin cytidylyltransferase MocA
MRGTDKLLTPIDGIPLLRRTALAALAALPQVVITLRQSDTQRLMTVQDLPAQIVFLADAALGLSASLSGAAAAVGEGRLMILPADMPDLTAQDLTRIIQASDAARDHVWRATSADGTPGHPVIFPPDLHRAFATLTGDQGARPLVQANIHRLKTIALPAQNALTDLDTPEAWQAWFDTRANSDGHNP